MDRLPKIGLAVSGGADSTALLAATAELRPAFAPVVLHVDHGLRPDSADDARFVRALARRFGFPCRTTRVRVVRRRGESVEMAARRVRLAFFARMTRSLGLAAVFTAHQADDLAETVILRLARGAGPEGLSGPKPVSRVNGVTFMRPLLGYRHAQLVDYLSARGIPWREDPTNGDLSIPRNRVRHEILPFLRERLDPKITEHLCRSAAILRQFESRPAPKTNAAGTAGRKPRSPGEPPPRFDLAVAPDAGFRREPNAPGILPAACNLSRAKLAGRTLEIRPWRAGDRIAPQGMGGHTRKLQDVFVTAKVPPAVRRTLPLLADAATGEILWVPGYRTSSAASVEAADAPSWRFTLTPSARESRCRSRTATGCPGCRT